MAAEAVLLWLLAGTQSSNALALPAKSALRLLPPFPVLLTGQILQAEFPQSRESKSYPSEHMEKIKEDLLSAFAKRIWSYKLTSLKPFKPCLTYSGLLRCRI